MKAYIVIILLFIRLSYVYCYLYPIKSSSIGLCQPVFFISEKEHVHSKCFILYSSSPLDTPDPVTTTSPLIANNVDLLLPGPGHTSKLPMTMNTAGRKETIKVVLTFALLWIVVVDKFNELKQKMFPVQSNSEYMIKLPGSISYRDVVLGLREPRIKEMIDIELNVSYNGKRIQPNEYIRESRQVNVVTFQYDESLGSTIESVFEVNGIGKAIDGMKIGGKRQIKIPSKLAFKDIPYIVDPAGMITVDVSMTEVNQSNLISQREIKEKGFT